MKPPEGLLAGVVKKVRDARGNLLQVSTRRLFGAKKAVVSRIQELGLGQTINTAHVERLNGTLRCQQARLTRRTRMISRRTRFLKWSLSLWGDLYNWGRLHGALDGRPPAMAEGFTDHAWSVSEYVRYPVHVSDLMREVWAEKRQNAVTSALSQNTPRKTLPTS